MLLIGISQPKFDETVEVGAASDGIGTYANESLMGSFAVAIAPGANLRYQF